MKKSWLYINVMGSLRRGFFLGALAIFTISPFHFDVAGGIRADSLLANDLCIEKDTLIKDPATGQMIPFYRLKSKNPKLSSSMNQLLSAYQFGGEPRMNAFAKETSKELNNDLIQVVIVVSADPHEPIAEELLENLKLRILEVGGEFELDFHNLLQVLLPVQALEEVANWPETKFIREPFRPHPIKDSSETGDQYKAGVFEVISSIQSDEGHEIQIPMEYSKEKPSENGSFYQGDLIDIQSLKSFCDETVCQKKIEIFSPDSPGYEEISDEEAKDYENSLKEDRYLREEKIVSPQAFSEVYFCLEYNCSSVTVNLGGFTHSAKLNCNNILGFGSVPAGTYSIYASGCGVSWRGTITVSGGSYGIPILSLIHI